MLKHLKARFSRLSSSATKRLVSFRCVLVSFRALSRGFGVFFGRSVSHVYCDTHDTDLKERRESLKETFCGFFLFEDFFFTRVPPAFLSSFFLKDGEISKRSVLFERFHY